MNTHFGSTLCLQHSCLFQTLQTFKLLPKLLRNPIRLFIVATITTTTTITTTSTTTLVNTDDINLKRVVKKYLIIFIDKLT